jgi:peroxiredoxin
MIGIPRGRLAIGLIGMLLIGTTTRAQSTGQQRAEAAGRGIVGAPAPRVVVKTIDGDTIDLGALYGKRAVYLKFWATWCTPCREQMPHFEHVYESAGPDLAVIAVNVGFNDSIEEIQRYRKQLGITMPIVFDSDGQLGAAFNLRVTPQHIVIGRNGRIQYVGHLADARLDAALVAARTSGPGQGAPLARSTGAASEGTHFEIGDLMPATPVKTLTGQSFRLRNSDIKQPTVLVFLSPWCESYLATTRPSVSEQCRVAREQVETLKTDHHVRWLGVASGLWATPEDLQEYRVKYKVTIPLTLDESGALFREFRVTNTPTLVVADSFGKIVRRVDSGADDTLAQALRDL